MDFSKTHKQLKYDFVFAVLFNIHRLDIYKDRLCIRREWRSELSGL